MNEFKVGDLVTYGGGGERLRVKRVWMEKFPALAEPQQVALLSGSRDDFSMRSAHLRPWSSPTARDHAKGSAT
jgi:hypothetical protein